MLSPVGIEQKPPNFDLSKEKLGPSGGTNNSKFMLSVGKKVWKKRISPFLLMRKAGTMLGRKLIMNLIKKRMPFLEEQEAKDMLDYLQQIYMRAGSTEYALFICFEVGVIAINALENENRLGNPELKFPISFFYGDDDWVNQTSGNRVV
jgi:hypothetical protein